MGKQRNTAVNILNAAFILFFLFLLGWSAWHHWWPDVAITSVVTVIAFVFIVPIVEQAKSRRSRTTDRITIKGGGMVRIPDSLPFEAVDRLALVADETLEEAERDLNWLPVSSKAALVTHGALVYDCYTKGVVVTDYGQLLIQACAAATTTPPSEPGAA